MIVNNYKNFEKEYLTNNIFIVGGMDKELINKAIEKIYGLVEKNFAEIRILDWENTSFEDIENACLTLTFFNNKKIVHIKKYNVIKANTDDNINDKSIIKQMVNLIKKLDSNTILLLTCDGQINLNNSVCKVVAEIGCLADFSLSKQDLPVYVDKVVNREVKRMGKAEINYFLECINYSSDQIYSELDKLIQLTLGEDKITIQHIDSIVSKTLESNIFKMVDSIGRKDAQLALSIFNNLINQKESELKILAMIIRQFRLLYIMKIIDERYKGLPDEEILKYLGLDGKKKFVIKNLRIQNQKFQKEELINCINMCLETDFSIKRGKINDNKLALELLILNICK